MDCEAGTAAVLVRYRYTTARAIPVTRVEIPECCAQHVTPHVVARDQNLDVHNNSELICVPGVFMVVEQGGISLHVLI